MPTNKEKKVVFIASPGDMVKERRIANDVIAELRREVSGQMTIEAYLYDDDPEGQDATENVQQQIVKQLEKAHLGICLLGERVGTPLSRDFSFPDGFPVTALEAFVQHLSPGEGTLEPGKVPLTGTVFELLYFRHRCANGDHRRVHCLIRGDKNKLLNKDLDDSERGFGCSKYYKQLLDGRYELPAADYAKYLDQRRWLSTLVNEIFVTASGAPDIFETEEEFRNTLQRAIRKGLGIAQHRVRNSGPGLQPVTNWEDLHGRQEELTRFREEHLMSTLVMIHGVSGVGKSSFLRAGLAHALGEGLWSQWGQWRTILLRAQDLLGENGDAFTAFSKHLSDWMKANLPASVAGDMAEDDWSGLGPEARGRFLFERLDGRCAGRPETSRVVLMLDQFEQLLAVLISEDATNEQRAGVQALLTFMGKLPHSTWGRTIIALPDAWHQLLEPGQSLDHEVSQLWRRLSCEPSEFRLQQPDGERRRNIVQRFFEVRGIDIDSDVVDGIARSAEQLEETSGASSVMPAIALTLQTLAQRHADHVRQLESHKQRSPLTTPPRGSLEMPNGASSMPSSIGAAGISTRLTCALAGDTIDIRHALARVADEAWEEYLSGRRGGWNTNRALHKLLSSLVDIEATHKTTKTTETVVRSLRTRHRKELEERSSGRDIGTLIDKMVSRRVLVDEAGVISLAHECILDAWNNAKEWYEESAWDQLVLNSLREWASIWRRNRCPDKLLFDREQKQSLPWPSDLKPTKDGTSSQASNDDCRDMTFSDLERVFGLRWDQHDDDLRDYLRKCLLSVNGRGKEDETTPDDALYWIACSHDADVLKHYVHELRFDVNRPRSKDKRTPLFAWAFGGGTTRFNILYDAHAKVNATDSDRSTPLIIAAWNGHTEAVKALLDKGALPDAKSTSNVHAAYYAASEGHFKTLMLLHTHCKRVISLPGWNNQTPLMAAAFRGRLKVVIWLLQQPDIDTRAHDTNGSHALDMAAQQGHLATLQRLLAHDPGLLNEPGFNNRTALMAAAYNGHEEMVAWLLQQPDIDTRARNTNGSHALDDAAQQGHLAIVQRLLAHDPGLLNEPGFNNRTALMAAAYNGHEEMVAWLLQQPDIDTRARNTTGSHALDGAAQQGHLAIVQRLLAHDPDLLHVPGANARGVLQAAVIGEHTQLVEELLRLGADPLTLDRNLMSAQWEAALMDRQDEMQALARCTNDAAPAALSIVEMDSDACIDWPPEVAATWVWSSMPRDELARIATSVPEFVSRWQLDRALPEGRLLSHRLLRLRCSDRLDLLELLFEGHMVRAFLVARETWEVAALLGGSSKPLHHLYTQGHFQVLDADQAREYCELFCRYMDADKGRFYLVESAAQFTSLYQDPATATEKWQARFMPILCEPADTGWKLLATVYYGDQAFAARFAFDPAEGKLSMEEDFSIPDGSSALMATAYDGHEEMVDWLLQQPDINTRAHDDGYRKQDEGGEQ